MVHIEEVFTAFQDYTIASIRAEGKYDGDPASWEREMLTARVKLQNFCLLHNLPIDFTEKKE